MFDRVHRISSPAQIFPHTELFFKSFFFTFTSRWRVDAAGSRPDGGDHSSDRAAALRRHHGAEPQDRDDGRREEDGGGCARRHPGRVRPRPRRNLRQERAQHPQAHQRASQEIHLIHHHDGHLFL